MRPIRNHPLRPLPGLFLLAVAASPTAAVQDAAPIERLLRLHHEQRVAHATGDVDLLVAPFAADFVEMSGGRVARLSPAEARTRFTPYLRRSRFLEWEDLRPPRVSLSPDGLWAELLVEKRVRTIPSDTSASTSESAVVYAWSERWRREARGWRLATVVSTERAGPDDPRRVALARRVRAAEILARARAALGGERAVANVATLAYSARCEGPSGPFVTRVASARDGRFAFLQEFPDRPAYRAGRSLAGAWTDDGPADSLGAVLASVVTAHELHLLALSPEARYRSPAAAGTETVDGVEADVVELLDALDAPVRFYYDRATGLPLGFRPVNHTGSGDPDILTRFADWRAVGDVRLPFSVVITQGEDDYRYEVTDASVEWLADEAFAPHP